MRRYRVSRSVSRCSARCALGRTGSKKTSAKPAPKTLSLSGCVVRGEKTPDQFTIEDAAEGKYRLTGLNLRDYVGQRVQIAGAVVETKS